MPKTDEHPQDSDPPPVAVSLPVVTRPAVRSSRMSRRRATVLIAIHLLIIGHVVHWLLAGRTLSPVEPSETMYALSDGYINAGAIFFALSLLATLVFGRFVCGWGCHLVAYQDLCAWLLEKVRIRPKPLRSRLLFYAPLVLALYMFVWPTVYRIFAGLPAPQPVNHLMTENFWATFPGFWVGAITFAVCGFAIVYFLGAKGFCTYACPYGGFFAVVDRVSLGRVVVSDACDHSGHCTSACGSNVRVHEEVARYGMIVDPGCMKCMDCISVCPNEALSFKFAAPSLAARAKTPGKPRAYDFTLAEELLMVVVGLFALFAFRGLYGRVPLLLAMGLAGMTAFLVLKLVHMMRRTNVRFQQLTLKRGGGWTRAGAAFSAAVVVYLAFVGHSAAVQYDVLLGSRLTASLRLGDDVWVSGEPWLARASDEQRARLERATMHLARARRRSLLHTPSVLNDLVWLYLAAGRNEDAEHAVRSLIAQAPDNREAHRGLAGVLRKMGRIDEALTAYHEALRIDPAFVRARAELCSLLIETGRPEDALAEYEAGLAATPEDATLQALYARLLSRLGRTEEAVAAWNRVTDLTPASADAFASLGQAYLAAGDEAAAMKSLTKAIDLDASHARAHYVMAMVLLQRRAIEDAVVHLRAAIDAAPTMAPAHYNLAVALFMLGRPQEALAPIREAIRLDPDDPDARGFLEVIERELAAHPRVQKEE